MKTHVKLKITTMILILLALIPAIALTGCKPDELSLNDNKKTIKIIVKKTGAIFWSVVQMGAEAAAKEFDVTIDFVGPSNEGDIEEQIKMVEQAIEERVNAIVLAAGDYIKLVDVAEKAIAAGIPVIVIDSDLKSDNVKSFIGTDNIDAGSMLGETMVDKVGSKCKVAVMSFIKGTATADQREAGLFKIMDQYPDIEVLSTEYCNSNEDMAEVLTEKLVDQFGSMDAIVCLNAYGTIGTARAIEKLDLVGDVKVIGFDTTTEEIELLEKGVIQALVTQNPFSMGYLGVKHAVDAMNGKAVAKRVDTGSKIITKDNMYLPENQKLLFPFTE